jgi:hypothetical protein
VSRAPRSKAAAALVAGVEGYEGEGLSAFEARFVSAYAQHGIASKAYLEAGGHKSGSYRKAYVMLREPHVREAIDAAVASDPLIIPVSERLRIRSEIARDTSQPATARLKALEDLDKFQGLMVERVDVRASGEVATLSLDGIQARIAELLAKRGEP